MSEVTREEALAAVYEAVVSLRRQVEEALRKSYGQVPVAAFCSTPSMEDLAARVHIPPHVFAEAKALCEPPPPLEVWAGEPVPRDIKKGERIVVKWR